MAKYRIKAPDGQTYEIEGPDGATQEQVQAEVLRQNPNAGRAFVGPPVEAMGEQASSAAPKTEGAFRRFLSREAQGLKRGAQLSGNMVTQAVGALPLMAADFGVALRNVGENVIAGDPILQKDYEFPSEMYRRGLEGAGVTTQPKGFAENAVNLVGQAVMGSRLPVPSVRNPAPANFVPPAQQALQAANRSGYVVPPATARPGSTLAGAAEGAAGKLTTAQRAAAANQSVTNRLAGQAVGIMDDGTVSRDALQAIRSEAGKAHEALRSFPGQITADTQFRVELASSVRSFANTAKQIPALAQDDVLKIAHGLEQPRFDPDVAVDAISLLRDRADVAFRGGDRTLGRSYRALSDAFEGLVERRLTDAGPQGKGLVDAFRDARQLIAKTYTVEGALRGENVDAQALARALDKGKYLSGTLRQIGQFAQRFPKAARVAPATESLPMYSPLDYVTGGASLAAGAMSGQPSAYLPFLYAAGRPALRNFLLSPSGQGLMVNGVPQNALRQTAAASAPVINALRE